MQIIPEEIITQKVKLTFNERMTIWYLLKERWAASGRTSELSRELFNSLYHHEIFDMRKEDDVIWIPYNTGGSTGVSVKDFRAYCKRTGFYNDKQYKFNPNQEQQDEI